MEACWTWTAAAPRWPSSPGSARTVAATGCRRGLRPWHRRVTGPHKPRRGRPVAGPGQLGWSISRATPARRLPLAIRARIMPRSSCANTPIICRMAMRIGSSASSARISPASAANTRPPAAQACARIASCTVSSGLNRLASPSGFQDRERSAMRIPVDLRERLRLTSFGRSASRVYPVQPHSATAF